MKKSVECSHSIGGGIPLSSDDISWDRISRVKRVFAYQPEEVMCYTVNIYNTLNEYLGRYRKRHPSLKKINDTCGYKKGLGIIREELVPRLLNEELLKDYGVMMAVEEGEDTNIKRLREVVEDKDTSYPMVNVSENFFKETYDIEQRGYGGWDHVITILAINHEEICFFDPYYGILKKRGVKERALIPLDKFKNLWRQAYNMGWMAWFTRKNKSLDEFQ